MLASRTLALGGLSIAFALATPAVTFAAPSSVDAYAGEALVLGKPTHSHRHATPSTRGGQAKASHNRAHAGASSNSKGSSGPSGGTLTSSRSGGGSSGGGASGTRAAVGGGTIVSGGTSAVTQGHAQSHPRSTPASPPSQATSASGATPSTLPAEVGGGTSLSALDIALIAAGLVAVAGVALLIRRSMRMPG